jgi:hypothetical protein
VPPPSIVSRRTIGALFGGTSWHESLEFSRIWRALVGLSGSIKVSQRALVSCECCGPEPTTVASPDPGSAHTPVRLPSPNDMVAGYPFSHRASAALTAFWLARGLPPK